MAHSPSDARVAIIVHDLVQARAALAAAADLGVCVTLRSAAGAAAYLGAGAFRALMDVAGQEFPDVTAYWVLDCEDAPGLALGALRIGIPCVRLTGVGAEILARLSDIAAQLGAEVDSDARPALDLAGERDIDAACRRWLATALSSV